MKMAPGATNVANVKVPVALNNADTQQHSVSLTAVKMRL